MFQEIFQWYKEIFNPMGFDPCNCSLKIWDSIGTPIPKMGVHLGVWRFNSHTFPYYQPPRNMKCGSQAFFLVDTFASPRLGLWHRYKLWTMWKQLTHGLKKYIYNHPTPWKNETYGGYYMFWITKNTNVHTKI